MKTWDKSTGRMWHLYTSVCFIITMYWCTSQYRSSLEVHKYIPLVAGKTGWCTNSSHTGYGSSSHSVHPLYYHVCKGSSLPHRKMQIIGMRLSGDTLCLYHLNNLIVCCATLVKMFLYAQANNGHSEWDLSLHTHQYWWTLVVSFLSS
jgi:hypothetical protein